MNDALTDALNAPAGRLAEILLKKLAPCEDKHELPNGMRERFEKLTRASDPFGRLARIRLAAEVSFLFERAPEWTKDVILPLFDWSSPDAQAAWSARKYSNYIGSPKLFELTKKPFLELFGRAEMPEEDLREFAGWLAAIMIANRRGEAGYPITTTEARSALRSAGTRSLASFAHRLAIEMESASPDQKIARWKTIVGPVFEAVWPLDIELQSAESTFKLVQILRATGNAFPEAADVIIPFIRPEDPRRQTSIFSIAHADDVLYAASPEKMLDLLAAVVGEAPGTHVYELSKALERIRAYAPQLTDTRKFQKLIAFASPI